MRELPLAAPLPLHPIAPLGAPTVYLAGPIAGCSYKGCTNWRDEATLALAEVGIKGLSPMRAKEYLQGVERKLEHPYPIGTKVRVRPGDESDGIVVDYGPAGQSYLIQHNDGGTVHWNESVVTAISDDVGFSATCEEYGHLSPLSGPRGIMTRDRFDATRCSVLLVNLLGATKVSVGTVMEIAWADLCRTPIVVAMEASGNPHEHAMIGEAIGFRYESLAGAISGVKAILS